jgi:hypothetical protein
MPLACFDFAGTRYRMQSMNERPYLPNYNPDFCRKVARWASATCFVWLTILLLILILADPSNGRCPGWTIYAKNGQATSLWLLAGMFNVLPTFWICFIAVRWEWFSQKVFDTAEANYQPFMTPKLLYDSFKPDPVSFPYNQMFVVVFVFWSLFCTSPLWIMLGNCTDLLR